MTSRTGYRLLLAAFVAIGLIVLAAGAYSFGYGDGAGTTAGAAAPAVAYGPWAYGPHFGWGFFGFLLPLFFLIGLILLIRFAIGGHRGGGESWGRGRYYRGPWSGPETDFEAWHRLAHGGSDQGAAAGGPSTGNRPGQ